MQCTFAACSPRAWDCFLFFLFSCLGLADGPIIIAYIEDKRPNAAS